VAQRARDIAERNDVYLFALDKFSDPDSIDKRLSGPPFEVDREYCRKSKRESEIERPRGLEILPSIMMFISSP
jgi:hypothetical protein